MIIDAQNAIIDLIKRDLVNGEFGDPPLLKNVMDADEFDDVSELAQFAPLVVVTYEGYDVPTSLPPGAVALLGTNWNVITVVRNSAGGIRGTGKRIEADAILQRLLSLLCGVKPLPQESASTLRLSSGPPNGFDDGGFGYYPLAFTLNRTVRGKPTRR